MMLVEIRIYFFGFLYKELLNIEELKGFIEKNRDWKKLVKVEFWNKFVNKFFLLIELYV